MAVISDIAGTTLNSFTINDKVTFYQNDNPDNKMGINGDFCFGSDGTIYSKREGIWVELTQKALPVTDGSNKLLYADESIYNLTNNITYNNADGHLHDDIVIQSEITDDSSTILPNIGYLNKNFVHNKGNEIIYNEKTFEILKSNQQIPSNSNDKTVATTEWIRNNISGKKVGEFIWSPVPLSNTTGLELCNGKRIEKTSYPEFYNYITSLSVNNVRNVSELGADYLDVDYRIKNSIREQRNSWGYFYYDSNYVWIPDYTKEVSLIPTVNGVIGEYSKGKVPNITGRVGAIGEENQPDYTTGAFYMTSDMGRGDDEGLDYFVYMDAHRCSDVYDNQTTTVQPESIKVYVYIVVATNISGDIASLDIDDLITRINDYKNAVNSISTEIHNRFQSGNNWIKDNITGVIIQWGVIQPSDDNVTISFTYPYSSSQSFSLTTTGDYSYYGSDNNINDLSASGFTPRYLKTDRPFRWMAIGK